MPVKALPVRQYMDQTVVPILREALRSLNDVRPSDPLEFLADYLLAARAKRLNSAHTNNGMHALTGVNGLNGSSADGL